MQTTSITNDDRALISSANNLIQKRKGLFSTVACALRTTDGKVFTGVNIEAMHSSPCSMCAEYPAIGAMYADAGAAIETIVAVDDEGKILPPCGRCREMIRQFGNPYVLLQQGKEILKTPLSELIPFWESEYPRISQP